MFLAPISLTTKVFENLSDSVCFFGLKNAIKKAAPSVNHEIVHSKNLKLALAKLIFSNVSECMTYRPRAFLPGVCPVFEIIYDVMSQKATNSTAVR